MPLRGKIRAITAITATAAAMGAGLLTAGPASAASYSCDADLCAGATAVSGNVVTIRAYPPEYQFYGHFELQTPNHRTLNSPSATWRPGGTGQYFRNINGGVGNYCVTAWEQTGSGSYTRIGYVCFSA